jgi:hypothetical protein
VRRAQRAASGAALLAPAFLAALLVTFLAAPAALAQNKPKQANEKFEKSAKFELKPKGGIDPKTVKVSALSYLHVWTEEDAPGEDDPVFRCKVQAPKVPADCKPSNAKGDVAEQPKGFWGRGSDDVTKDVAKPGTVENQPFKAGQDAKKTTVNPYRETGIEEKDFKDSFEAKIDAAKNLPNAARAKTSFDVKLGPLNAQKRADGITGTYGVDGAVDLTLPLNSFTSRGYGFGYAAFEVTDKGLGKGKGNLAPKIEATRSGTYGGKPDKDPSKFIKIGDPFYFRVDDPGSPSTGPSIAKAPETTGVLLDIGAELRGEGDEISWDAAAGSFYARGTDTDFFIRMLSPYTIQQGMLELQLRDGVVAGYKSSGIFSSAVPIADPLVSGGYRMSLGGISFDYDLGPMSTDALVTLGSTAEGAALADLTTPEPGSTLLLGSGLAALAGLAVRARRRG